MKITLTINGKQIEAEVDEKTFREVMKGRKKTGYVMDECEWKYYCENAEGRLVEMPIGKNNGGNKNKYYECGNFYSDAKIAEENIRADTLFRNLRQMAAAYGGCIAPKRIPKLRIGTAYSIIYTRGKLLAIGLDTRTAILPRVVFSTREGAEVAIKHLGDEILWYFTEYDPMPEGWWDS